MPKVGPKTSSNTSSNDSIQTMLLDVTQQLVGQTDDSAPTNQTPTSNDLNSNIDAAMLLFRRQLALNEMMPALCHDMNNPLAVVSGTSQQINKLIADEKLEPQKAQTLFERLDRNTDRLVCIVRGLGILSLNPFKEGFRLIECKKMLEDVIPFSGHQYKKHAIELFYNLDESSPRFFCRPALWSQTLIVLLDLARTNIQSFKQQMPRRADLSFTSDGTHTLCQIQYVAPEGNMAVDWPQSARSEFVKESLKFQKGFFSFENIPDPDSAINESIGQSPMSGSGNLHRLSVGLKCAPGS